MTTDGRTADESAERAYWDNHTSDGRCKYPLTCAEDGCRPVTVQPARDQLLDMTERLGFLGDRPELCDEVVDGLWAALDRAEHRIARLEAQSDIRGRAVVMYRERAREAEAERDEWRQTALDERAAALDALEQIKVREARIKAVQDVLEQKDADLDAMSNPPREHRGVLMADIRRALDGDA